MPVAYQVYYGKIELSQSLLSEQNFSSNFFSMLKYSYGPLMSTYGKKPHEHSPYQVYYGKIELSQSLLSEQNFSSSFFLMLKYSYGPLMSTHAKEIAQ